MIPASRPVIGERELELVREVLESGHLSLGPRLKQFEDAFAEWIGVPHTSAVAAVPQPAVNAALLYRPATDGNPMTTVGIVRSTVQA